MTPSDDPAGSPTTVDSFPRLLARTGRFTLGAPRSIAVTPDGSTVLFVRSSSGTDRVGSLWAFDVSDGTERQVADPRRLLGDGPEQLSPAERSRRERARESGGGIVSHTVDDTGTTAVFALSGDLWSCHLPTGVSRRHDVDTDSVIDPRIDPTGTRVAFAAADGALRLLTLSTGAVTVLATPASDTEVWGRAEFIAGEEMGRHRGFWWAPDGSSLLVERYDDGPVQTIYVSDPAHPQRRPVAQRYPAAGTPNAAVDLWHLGLEGTRTRIDWDGGDYPYLARVHWSAAGAVVQVLTRDQRRTRYLRPDLATPAGSAQALVAAPVIGQESDPDFLELADGLPQLTPDGRLLTRIADRETDTYRLALDGAPISPAGTQLVTVARVTATDVLAVVADDPTERQLVRIGYDGAVSPLTTGAAIHGAVAAAGTIVMSRHGPTAAALEVTVTADGRDRGRLRSHAADPGLPVTLRMHRLGPREVATIVLLPRDHEPGSRRLPVIMAPYGGPHHQEVLAAGRMHLRNQYLADQGFAVIVADGRGTGGRGPAWDRALRDDFAGVTLADQVDTLAAAADAYPDDLDTERVGIMGWSYGGYLAALAVLDRPDVFHAAVAGAPVTDWTLYDTCYTERYLGDPRQQPEVYVANSLIGRAGQLTRPLLLIHGMVDDNVVVAHTLRLSAALLAAGREHQVLPLTGITHMTGDEVVAENLLLTQVAFLRRALA